ncbi:MAG: Gfo/Idh/MocA family oxidoreductase [Bacteroidetes bacterium]|nr:Gfo/Idh/MocA family oxidoreductase [Bacteroidota bacterium]
MKNFALIGVAGFIAPRHLQAIRDTGNQLVAAMDKFDSVGIMDSYFPEADFFTEFERFDRHLDKLRRQGRKIDYISICSPNYLHDSHIRFALRHQADAICEKPLVLNPWNLDALAEIERETRQKINTILQLRLHPAIIHLKKRIEQAPASSHYQVSLRYITSRGHWYHHSWKGEEAKSGGIVTNIGIHFFDMLQWIFGNRLESTVNEITSHHASGRLELQQATVDWFLSINAAHLPREVTVSGKRTYRSLKIEGEEIEFSEGFVDLHTMCYQRILEGKGFGIEDARQSIESVYSIRQMVNKK